VVIPPPELRVADEGVEDLQLERRAREATLLELTGHGQQALDERGQVFPWYGAAPGVGAGTPVREDPARRDEPLFALGTKVGDRFEPFLFEQA
jgi:hypothetical protein